MQKDELETALHPLLHYLSLLGLLAAPCCFRHTPFAVPSLCPRLQGGAEGRGRDSVRGQAKAASQASQLGGEWWCGTHFRVKGLSLPPCDARTCHMLHLALHSHCLRLALTAEQASSAVW